MIWSYLIKFIIELKVYIRFIFTTLLDVLIYNLASWFCFLIYDYIIGLLQFVEYNIATKSLPFAEL